MIPYNILHIGLFIIFIFFIIIYFIFYSSNNIVAVEDDNYMLHFDVYGDVLFQIYGSLGLVKSIFDEFSNFDEFNTFFNEIKTIFQYKNGDSIEIKAGKVDFSTKIVQRKYNRTQTYMEVLYPLNQQYHIVFYRIIKYLDLSDLKTPNRDTNQYHFKQLIQETKLSSANKDILTNFNESALLELFTTALGYTYVFQYFIHKYDDFEKALNVIKKYHKLFITKYGESMFIRKNTNTITPFSFQNNNTNYIFQNDDWLYYYDTNVAKNKNVVGKNPTDSYKYVAALYAKFNLKHKMVNIAQKIVELLIQGGAIVTYEWFNNIMETPVSKKSVVFGYKQYYYGSGYNYKI